MKTIILNLEKLKVNKLKIKTWMMDDCTLGILTYGDFKCFTLELPWNNNEVNVSCIPRTLAYKGEKHESPANGSVIAITNVLNRTYIQIHSANFLRQLKGCIAVGDSIKFLDGDSLPDVTNSKNTLKALLAVLPDNFIIEIT
jgi:hypothetical protein